ncbi:hypothetical protein COMNV_00597 [Commensalibacter sp. Nvir]|uniref:lysozyme n=1 Tax=Commensalibacter sp. Nvir TaxID=3069817 RepID=UPI002D7611CC|nr:hypothetical protein COMNV_00597 [Commensalibacter sp. Nvir]
MAYKRKLGVAGGACAIMTLIPLVLHIGGIRTNQAGLELIGDAEGCRRDSYHCPAGLLTDGVGNTTNVRVGEHKTDTQIANDWNRNVRDAEWCVNRYGNGKNLSTNEFSAVTSITFNVGCLRIRNSTLYKKLNSAQPLVACEEFNRWIYVGKKPMEGLIKRRAQEKALCLKK